MEQMKAFIEKARSDSALKEEDLEAVAGGGKMVTENRYDPGECAKCEQVQYRCVGFLGLFHCDHYTKKEIKDGEYWRFLNTCAMGCFSYKSDD